MSFGLQIFNELGQQTFHNNIHKTYSIDRVIVVPSGGSGSVATSTLPSGAGAVGIFALVPTGGAQEFIAPHMTNTGGRL